MKNKMEKIKKLWFKAKPYGYGWYPSTWQGFLIILISVSVFMFFWIDIIQGKNIFIGSAAIIANFIILFLVCYARGEKPRWRWGKNT
jgi:nitrate reductase gamma subunit